MGNKDGTALNEDNKYFLTGGDLFILVSLNVVYCDELIISLTGRQNIVLCPFLFLYPRICYICCVAVRGSTSWSGKKRDVGGDRDHPSRCNSRTVSGSFVVFLQSVSHIDCPRLGLKKSAAHILFMMLLSVPGKQFSTLPITTISPKSRILQYASCKPKTFPLSTVSFSITNIVYPKTI